MLVDSRVVVEIKLITGDTVVIEGQGIRDVADQITGHRALPLMEIETAGGRVFINPAHVVSVAEGRSKVPESA